MTVSILQGDALERLRELPGDHFHCVVTSPPYWGLRDYGVDGQIGLEETPEAWCTRLVEVFREVRRVLRPDGVCFVNIGDSYASAPNGRSAADTKAAGNDDRTFRDKPVGVPAGLKAKDLVGQPWLLAFALRADGWWLRGDYIWAKPNPMPESVRDRCTKAHEYVFHLSKSERYFWDAEAVREPHQEPWRSGTPEKRLMAKGGDGMSFAGWDYDKREYNPAGRNLRSVWTIATDPLPSIIVDGEKLDHFASYPVELARRCILAGTSAKGCCPECGAPWARVVENSYTPNERRHTCVAGRREASGQNNFDGAMMPRLDKHVTTTGWRPTCLCRETYQDGPYQLTRKLEPIPCRVLDPFGGSGRTALAAEELGRDSTLIELNPASVRMAHAQIERAKARRFIGDDATRQPTDPRQGALL